MHVSKAEATAWFQLATVWFQLATTCTFLIFTSSNLGLSLYSIKRFEKVGSVVKSITIPPPPSFRPVGRNLDSLNYGELLLSG